jgi:hypothetical protein
VRLPISPHPVWGCKIRGLVINGKAFLALLLKQLVPAMVITTIFVATNNGTNTRNIASKHKSVVDFQRTGCIAGN